MSSEEHALKDRIRAIIRDRRSGLSARVINRCASAVSDYLEDYISSELGIDTGSLKVASYMPVSGELSTIPFCQKVIDNGGVLLMPKVTGDDIVFYAVSDLIGDMERGRYGIPEPADHCAKADIRDADVIIVPAIAYNDEGIRLGQGGGYYDRVWEYLGGDSPDRKAVLIGVCYDFQIVSSIPVLAHDMAVDVIIGVESEEEDQ